MPRRRPIALVTGATGFVGRALARRLQTDCDVTALARRPQKVPNLGAVEWIRMDLREPLDRARLPRRIDALVHLASAREPSERAGPDDLFRVNAAATAALVDYAVQAGARRFVYGSTGGVCGYHATRIRESTPAAPFDAYTLSKWHGETIVARETRLSSAIVRYFFPYGPEQTAGIVPRLVARIAAGEPITLFQQGRVPHLNPVYLDDAVELTCRALAAQQPMTINCAGPEVVSVRDICDRIGHILQKTPRFENGRDPRIGHMVASLARSARVLGFRPQIDVETGLRRTLSNDV